MVNIFLITVKINHHAFCGAVMPRLKQHGIYRISFIDGYIKFFKGVVECKLVASRYRARPEDKPVLKKIQRSTCYQVYYNYNANNVLQFFGHYVKVRTKPALCLYLWKFQA